MAPGNRVLLIIAGGIAAYKSLELIRLLKKAGIDVSPVMTPSAAEFVTPLSVSALSGEKVYTSLFDLTDEAEMGHIQLSRVADLVVVAPATAHLMARAAQGQADDLATTLLLATDTPVLVAPAMNVRMWDHPATQRNIEQLLRDGVQFVGPNKGSMACGEYGYGRMAEPSEICQAVQARLTNGPLTGKKIVVTSGPTHEPIDPVRYIANRSSGAQGTALAVALRDLGADVTFVTGPADVAPPQGVRVAPVQTALEMQVAVSEALPADAAIFAAAVSDFRIAQPTSSKIKKDGDAAPQLEFALNPDILAGIAQLQDGRPGLVVGFAAETDDVIAHATAKRSRKGCDWIVANDVRPDTGIMGGTENAVTLITASGSESWPRMSKTAVAQALAQRIADTLSE
jgi:phosphopantothenoylcysteine decarboxylase/phosphopantothenate--cysteine ligase